jgi:crotonobetainyl-CoA:carnitine CoA-transferase CaiB-like acyl-CoA transferase
MAMSLAVPTSPLAGLRVVDLSTGIAGGYAGRMLADAGASVLKIEVGEGDPLRRWSPSGAEVGDAGGLFQFLHRGQECIRCLSLGQVADRLDAAEIIIADGDPADPAVLDRGRSGGQVVVAVSAYGLTGPAAGRPSSELVLQAESGSLATRGHPSDPPMMAGGRTTEWISGAYAAAGALAAVLGGVGELVDVSMLEVAHVAGTAYGPLYHQLADRPPIRSVARTVESVEIHPTANGWIGFTTNSGQQFRDFLVLIERPDLLGDTKLASVGGRMARLEEWTGIVNGWTSRLTTEEILDRASILRIPAAPVLDAASVTELPHLVERHVFRRSDDGTFVYPRPPWRLDGHDPAEDGDGEEPGGFAEVSATGRLPLEGIRVLDMTAWWAGPASTHLLASLGADVIHLESTGRPDGMRMTGGIFHAKGDWWERSPFFLSVNSNKRDLTLDLTTEGGREVLERLLRESDVLVENFSPRVFDNLGLSWETVHEINDQLLVVRMPAFGLDGPWRDRPGFAQTMEQLSGLAWLTGWRDGQPHNQRGPCDPNGGIHAAFAAMCGVVARRRDGQGHLIEVPFIEVALNAAAEQIVEYSSTGVVLARDGNRAPTGAPQGVYPCSGVEQWLALSVETDAQWGGLRAALGEPGWATGEGLDTHAGRWAGHDMIDAELAVWASERTLEDALRALLAQGVPAGQVRDPRLAGDHEQLVARRFFETLDHPIVGLQPFASLPFRFGSVTSWLRRPAPTLGQHNGEILGELGYGEEEIERLEIDGIIGTSPVGL